MSRRGEVDKKIEYMLDAPAHQIDECLEESFAIARTLADEVDALRKENAHWEHVHGKAPKCAHLNCCAEAYAERAVITKLLAMLEPGEKPDYPDARMAAWKTKRALYARACEIAGRKE